MLAQTISFVLLITAATLSSASASFSPVITYPYEGIVWYKGQHRFGLVTWNATEVPEELANVTSGTTLKLWKDKDHSMDIAVSFRLGAGRVEFPLNEGVFECKRCVVSIGSDRSHGSGEFEIIHKDDPLESS